MAGKRKRSYSGRRYYKRRRTSASASSVAKQMAKILQDHPGYGNEKSAQWQRYGPSEKQMRDNPGVGRTAAQTQARLIDNYRGPGAFWPDVGKWGSRIGGAALGALNPWGLGSMVGATDVHSGWDKGAEFSKAMGWGAYNENRINNDLIGNSGAPSSAPLYHSTAGIDETGDVIVSNRELVKIITASPTEKAYKEERFSLNPADGTFYHLKKTAEQYEQFEFLGLMFQFVPMYGEGGDNEVGIIGMAANYDPAQDRNFTQMEDIMRYKGSITTKPSVGCGFGIECDPSKRSVKTLYVRDKVERDKAFTDPATFHFASEGVKDANAVLGQLWVTYTCRFRNIKLEDPSVSSDGATFEGEVTAVSTANSYQLRNAFSPENLTAQNLTNSIVKEWVSNLETTSGSNNSYITLKFDATRVSVGDHVQVRVVAASGVVGSHRVSNLYFVSSGGNSVSSGVAIVNPRVADYATGLATVRAIEGDLRETDTAVDAYHGTLMLRVTSIAQDPIAVIKIGASSYLQSSSHHKLRWSVSANKAEPLLINNKWL